ncbi:hypothetical protein [Chryseobacterium pennipullorum]|uniref:Uncharacterized protein n=1 Tax=Chryseobacterium pennipullorum TaxID=2258963 RepID=A0A3D9AS19_9FLAO|nr:hypothetical protein [Chryseobacterium pennipullorum]REC44191.1 hypothetical protein DRF67_17840 [Chryseobacterium pennipullorum]
MDTAQNTDVQASTPAEESVVFVNSEVLAPPTATPMTGASKIMTDQATGMMMQDLQSFLKGFEQLGLIAVSRLANNMLTYGKYHHDPNATGKDQSSDDDVQDVGKGNEVIKDLFKIISDYAEVKTKISSLIPPPATAVINNTASSVPAASTGLQEEDPTKKKSLTPEPEEDTTEESAAHEPELPTGESKAPEAKKNLISKLFDTLKINTI